MKMADLFELLSHFCPLLGRNDLLIELSDMSLPEELRGPGKNLMYGPYLHKKEYSEEERKQKERELRQRWVSGKRSITKNIAKFWHQNFDTPSMIDGLERSWHYTEASAEIASILNKNGYNVQRQGVSDFLATALKQGLAVLSSRGGGDSIDDNPWDPSLLRASMDAISTITEPKVSFKTLSKEDIRVVGNFLHLGNASFQLPAQPEVPVQGTKMERNYLRQILLAIGSASEINVDSIRSKHAPSGEVEAVKKQVESERPEYVEIISQAREGYFNADHLRMIMRDSAVDGDAEFEKIKNETYFAVSPAVRRRYSDGLEKMHAALEKAVSAPLQQSHISSVSGLFTVMHRHGVTHMLVNDNRIEWVSDER